MCGARATTCSEPVPLCGCFWSPISASPLVLTCVCLLLRSASTAATSAFLSPTCPWQQQWTRPSSNQQLGGLCNSRKLPTSNYTLTASQRTVHRFRCATPHSAASGPAELSLCCKLRQLPCSILHRQPRLLHGHAVTLETLMLWVWDVTTASPPPVLLPATSAPSPFCFPSQRNPASLPHLLLQLGHLPPLGVHTLLKRLELLLFRACRQPGKYTGMQMYRQWYWATTAHLYRQQHLDILGKANAHALPPHSLSIRVPCFLCRPGPS